MSARRLLLTLLVASLSQTGFAQTSASPGGAYAGGGVNGPSSSESMLFMQLQQMQGEMAQLRGMLEEQQEQIRRLQREGLERYQDLDQRVTAAATRAPAPVAPDASAGGSSATPNSVGHTANNAAPVAPQNAAAPGDPEKERLYYDTAFDLVKNKDFDKASQAFAAFLRKYPNSQYAANAQYWLGEVSLAKGDLKGAGQAFAAVAQNYPKHSKVPDSLYKMSDVESRLGNVDKAQSILKQIISQYPDSSAAQLARRQLKL